MLHLQEVALLPLAAFVSADDIRFEEVRISKRFVDHRRLISYSHRGLEKDSTLVQLQLLGFDLLSSEEISLLAQRRRRKSVVGHLLRVG